MIPVCHPRLSLMGGMWLLCSFQGPSERALRARRRHGGRRRAAVSQNSTACTPFPHPLLGAGRGPGSVDVLGHTVGSWAWSPLASRRRRTGRPAPCRMGTSLVLPRKEVIQPHLPVRLPCYDFTPVTSPTFDGSLPQGVRPPASGVAHSRGVTGGVYKARERIHRGNADPRLLATPPSCRRVSAYNPNRDAL